MKKVGNKEMLYSSILLEKLKEKGIKTDNNYDFLDNNDNLKDNIIYLGLGGELCLWNE